MGRTPLEVALFRTSAIGCWVLTIRSPSRGSSGLGALMLTPAIGPATAGLRGFSVLVSVQPLRIPDTTQSDVSFFIGHPGDPPARDTARSITLSDRAARAFTRRVKTARPPARSRRSQAPLNTPHEISVSAVRAGGPDRRT